jgi:hypothetical protein
MAERRLTLTRVETGVLEIDGQEYAVRIGADLDVEVLTEIMELQLEIRRFGATNTKKLPDWIRRAKKLVLDVVHEHHPDVDEIKLSPTELVQVLTFLGGTPDVASQAAAELAEGAPVGEAGEPGDPPTSQRRSGSRSSRSARRSTSGRSGGEESAGASSSSISAGRTAA